MSTRAYRWLELVGSHCGIFCSRFSRVMMSTRASILSPRPVTDLAHTENNDKKDGTIARVAVVRWLAARAAVKARETRSEVRKVSDVGSQHRRGTKV